MNFLRTYFEYMLFGLIDKKEETFPVNLPRVNAVAQKANQVIESCTNQEHIKGARRYVNQVFKIYSSPHKSRRNQLFTINPNIYWIYRDLMDKVEDMEYKLRFVEDSGKV